MIYETLIFLSTELNKFLTKNQGLITQFPVTINNIAKLDDPDILDVKAKIILSLINIEEDKVSKIRENYTSTPTGIVYRNPPVLVNLYVLFAANYTGDYAQSLKMISKVMQFFQSQSYFTPLTHPGLDPKILQLNADLFTLNFEQINHIWSTLGGKYLPSVMYKVRQLSIEDENAVETEGAWIEEIITKTNRIN
jgi:hypothetical protein